MESRLLLKVKIAVYNGLNKHKWGYAELEAFKISQHAHSSNKSFEIYYF